MKVLHVIDSGGLFGAETMLLNLACEQRRLGMNTTICSIGNPKTATKPVETEARRRNLDVRPLRMLPGPNIAGALRILHLARTGGYDVIHSHGYKGNILLGLAPRRLRRQPIVATLHGWTNTGGLTKIRTYEWADSRVLNRLDGVVLVNRSMLKTAGLHRLKSVPVRIIPNGIPLETNNSEQSEYQRDDKWEDSIRQFCRNGFIIGSIGRLAPEKAFNTMLQALFELRSLGVPAKLIVIGEGPERANIERLVSDLNLGEHVYLPGYKPDAHRYLRYFDAFAMSSLTEGLPISLLEAMRARVPVVATSVGAIPEVLQNGTRGMLVSPNNAHALAEALRELYRNRERYSCQVDAAAAILRTKYSATAMAEQYLAFYKDALSRFEAIRGVAFMLRMSRRVRRSRESK